MKWEITIMPKNSDAKGATFSVDAENWMDALKSGLDRLGKKEKTVKIISCQIMEDHSICITDMSTQSVFFVKPIEAPSLDPLPEPEGESFLESKSSGSIEMPQEAVSFMEDKGDMPPSPPALAQHNVFYSKDENPGPGSNVVYRERVIAVPPDTSKDSIAGMMQHYFQSLSREMTAVQGNKIINLAVYDHEFKGNPKGLALAALSWQDWKNQAPVIIYPQEEAAAAQSGAHVPMAQPQAGPKAAPPAAAQAPRRAQTPLPIQAPVHAPAHEPARSRRSSSEMKLEDFDPNQVLTEVFEELQDMFLTQTQDEAADFVLNLAMKKIAVEGGTIFLADINTRDLMFAAVKGPNSEKLRGQKLKMTKGIVGFAAREGAAIAIADVRKDPRFCSDFDQEGGFITKSVLCSPIQYEGRTFGAIELVNKKKGDMFSQPEINVISYLASQLAEFIATSLPSGEPDFLEEEKAQVGSTMKRPPPAQNMKKKKKGRK
jgi:putative methionine-R-sulfoxide reductase with GAF domain